MFIPLKTLAGSDLLEEFISLESVLGFRQVKITTNPAMYTVTSADGTEPVTKETYDLLKSLVLRP